MSRNAWRSARNVTFHVYVLVDPRDGLPRYIGCTMNPRQRLAAHVTSSYSEGNKRRCAWVHELRGLGLRPKMMGLDKAIGYRAAMALEMKWIAKGLERGWPLLNGATRQGKPAPEFVLEPYVEATHAHHVGTKPDGVKHDPLEVAQ